MTEQQRTELEISLNEQVLAGQVIKLGKESRLLDADIARKELEVISGERYLRSERAKADESRIMDFNGAVSGSSAAAARQKLADWHRRDPGEPIEIIFNSPGGSVIDGLALYDYILELRRRGTRITTITMGMAASMGGILLQAGDLRVASANSVILIHEVSSGAGGKVSEIEDQLKFMEVLQDKCLNILADRSTLSVLQIRKRWIKKDWWLTADEALKLGFVDEIR